jgi:hypothetical protein
MKRCLVADLHGVSPSVLIGGMSKQVGGWAFLGDYDDPRILKEIRALSGDRIVTIGNHDYYYAVEKPSFIMFGSPEIIKRAEDTRRLWNEHEDEKEFVFDCIENPWGSVFGVTASKPGRFGNVLYTHASLNQLLTHALSERFYSQRRRYEAIVENFFRMKEKDVCLMFRGHDHISAILSSNLEGGEIREEYFPELVPFRFNEGRRYIVSVGNFSKDNYAVFDDEEYEVTAFSNKSN